MSKFLRVLVLILVPSLSFASTILQFNQVTFNTPFVTSGGSITATNVPVNVVFDPSICLNLGCGGLSNGVYSMNFNSAPVGGVTVVSGVLFQNYAGSISFTRSGSNLLSVQFTDVLFGSVNGSNPTLNASQPPDMFTGTSDVFDPAKLNVPRGFALSFSNWTPGLQSLSSTQVRDARADGTGTFNAATSAVPEPSTYTLLGMGFGVMAFIVYRKRQTPKASV